MYIFGYDPGGNGNHGVAVLEVSDSLASVSIDFFTLETTQDVIDFFDTYRNSLGIGIDTLTRWCTGVSGWRPADHWLKKQYKSIQNSIMSPNSLFGSMSIGGMLIKKAYSQRSKVGLVSETHPKVIYFELTDNRYDWQNSKETMDSNLSSFIGLKVVTKTDHEFDAIISSFCVQQYLLGNWKNNLHELSLEEGDQYIDPFVESVYCWP
ncbi:MAG: hypothetical protein FVQ82_02610 [Planctomycetes bacterium]|nr:hypothetical protein [Planctomycetota bacterium]